MQTALDMMARHTHSSVYRLRPNHGVAFLDIEISASHLARCKTCFVEETVTVGDHQRTVLVPVGHEQMFDDGSAWHPETFQPLGSNEALWLTGYQGIQPLVGHWLPLPYFRVMTTKSTADCGIDQGPLNWVRIFISPPDEPLHEATTIKAVLAIDTQLAGASRLDQRRYNAPGLEDVNLGSTFVLADAPDQLASLLSEAWLNDWLHEIVRNGQSTPSDADTGPSHFEQHHIARYVFLLQVLCEACAAPILRFTGQARGRKPVNATPTELILDLSDDVGLAVLVGQEKEAGLPDADRSRLLSVRDLGQPTRVHCGALPVRIEFDNATFGYPAISRLSGRSNAFNWSSFVRIGEEATRLALRPKALAGATGTTALALNVQDTSPISGSWRSSAQSASSSRLGASRRSVAMLYLTEAGEFIGSATNQQPAVRPRFSRSSLITLFIAELILHAVSVLNAPRKDADAKATPAGPEFLSTLRLSLPVSVEPAERDIILTRAREGIDLVWRAQGWDRDANGFAPKKPSVDVGLGGDFGVQMIYLQNQLNDVYGGELTAFIEDLDPVRKNIHNERPALQFASMSIGFSTTRVVVACYGSVDGRGTRPRLVATKMEPQGLAAIHDAILDDILLPALDKALRQNDNALPSGTAHRMLGRAPLADGFDRLETPLLPEHVTVRLQDKILKPAARALADIYATTTSDGTRGAELLTLTHLVTRGGGRLEPLSEIIGTQDAPFAVDEFRWSQVTIPFSRPKLRQVILKPLKTLLRAATDAIEVGQTDMIFVTSTFSAAQDLRDLILSLVPISPHRLVILDGQWTAQQFAFDGALDLPVPVRSGIQSTMIGKRRLLNVDELASIEQAPQLESEVA